jgi:hypothetical protein
LPAIGDLVDEFREIVFVGELFFSLSFVLAASPSGPLVDFRFLFPIFVVVCGHRG